MVDFIYLLVKYIMHHSRRNHALLLQHRPHPLDIRRAHVGGVVAAEGADALAVEERPDVAADLVDVVGLLPRDDVEENGFEADERRFVLGFLFDVFGSTVSHDPRTEVVHFVGRDAAARLEEGVLLFHQVQLPLADAEVAAHEVVEGVVGG